MKAPLLPKLYLGTMTFAWNGQTSSVVDEPAAMEMVQAFVNANVNGINHNAATADAAQLCHYLDTARVYGAGATEPMVGAVLAKLDASSSSTFSVGTKANPAVAHGLSPQGIQEQLKASLDALQLTRVGEFYLHQPDTQHPLLESLQATHALVQEGTVASVGMSNYHAVEMERAFQICREHDLTPPTVYQGLYNPLNRLVEDELLPLLRQNNCSFVAYNPLAGGLLTGKHSLSSSTANPEEEVEEQVAPGRFRHNDNYLPRFYTPANFAAVQLIRQCCEEEGISLVEASYRWLLRHSALRPGVDGVIVGASSVAQLRENLDACRAAAEKGPLSPRLRQVLDQAWEIVCTGDGTGKTAAFPYWRSYSSDFPNRAQLDPGASYTVPQKRATSTPQRATPKYDQENANDGPDRIRVLGICGGIGSGKSTVCQSLVADFGCLGHIEADRLAHDVYKPNSPVLSELADAFGAQLVTEDGNLDRSKLGKLVFDNPQALQKLERIVWPHVQSLVENRIQELKDSYEPGGSTLPIIIVEAAVMLDAGWHTFQDGLWVVKVPPDVALARLQDHRNMPHEQALQRIEAQKSRRGMDNLQEEIDSGLVSAVVDNSGDAEELKRILAEKLNDNNAWYGTTHKTGIEQ